MKLIVGLGNPGKEYEMTRHNVGFICLDYFITKNNIYTFKEKFGGLYTKWMMGNEQIIFLKPLSYMNLSGKIVKKYVDYYKINPQDILIIHDDLDIPLGRIKLKIKGSSGGHNGIKSIIDELHTDVFKRLKIGISHDKNINTKDYVLGKFNKEEQKVIEELLVIINDIIMDFFMIDFDKLMSKYNAMHK